jgi:predicted GNAT family N-acyltransferase
MIGRSREVKMLSHNDIVVKLVETPAELAGAFSLRIRVFVGEQGVPADIELDDADTDPDTVHAVALHNSVVIATGRLLPDVDGKGPHIGRMAVEQDWRRGGVGGQVLHFLEEQGRALGFRQITLHAQEYVKSFYAGQGYREVGEMFLEVDIPHREMVKEL